MIIRRIHIGAFGPLRDFDCELYSGMNIIRGDNESGKTSLAMFIKFVFYGLSGRGSDSTPSERKKYVNWNTGTAEGYIIASADGVEYRLERSLSVSVKAGSDKESVSESLTVTNTATGERVNELENCPGAILFGVPEQIFVNTVFSGQSGRARIDGADTAAAVENMLFSADETLNVKKAAERLDKFRRGLLHKNGSGGKIHELREKCAELKDRFDTAQAHAADIIELEGSFAVNSKLEKETEDRIKWQTAALRYYDAVCLTRDGEDAAKADAEKAKAEEELRRCLSMCCEKDRLAEGRRLAADLEAERGNSSEFSDRLTELQVGAAAMIDPDSPDDPTSLLDEFRRHLKGAGVLLAFAVVFAVLAVVAGGASAAMYALKNQLFLAPLAGAAALAVISGVFFILRGKKFSRMRGICTEFGADDEDSLEKAVEYEMSRRTEADSLLRKADFVKLSLEESGKRLETLEIEARAVAASFEDCCMAEEHPADSTDALDRLRRAITLAEKRQSEAESARAIYETASAVAAAKWQTVPRDKLAAAMDHVKKADDTDGYPTDEKSAQTVQRELSFNEARLDALRKKNHALKVDLAAKRAAAESPSELWDRLNDTTAKLKRLNAEHDAALLAYETLAEAGENIRRDIIPRIVRRASKLFSVATGGRYESLGSGSTFRLSAVIDGHTRDSALLSSGTEDLAYVCLRLSLAAELFGDKKPTLIFDESLAFMDPSRTTAATEAMSASGLQIILFTCRPEDGADITLRSR